MVFWQFSVLIAIFSGLVTFMTYLSANHKQPFSFFLIFSVFILGCVSLFGITKDMLATHSSKVAIRKRMIEIEERLNKQHLELEIKLWSIIIENRNKHGFEEFPNINKFEFEIDFLKYSSYLIIILWIIISVIFIIQGLVLINTG